MSAFWIFFISFSFALLNIVANQLLGAETYTQAPQNRISSNAASNFGLSNAIQGPNQLQLNAKPINTAVSPCPNTEVLHTILNILTRSLPLDNKSLLDPEKFKYVLALVKKLLEKTPQSPENLNLFTKFINLNEHLDKIYIPTVKRDGLDDNVKAKISLQYDVPLHHHNCQELFNIIISMINSIYSQIIKNCYVTGKCNNNYVNNIQGHNSGINPYYIRNQNNIPENHQDPKNQFNYFPQNKESTLGGNELINSIKNEEGKGIHDILTIIQNYRTNDNANSGFESQDSNPIKKPQSDVSSVNLIGINQIPNDPNQNLGGYARNPWQSTLYPLDNLGSNSQKNQQYVKILSDQLTTGNTGGISNSINTGEAPYGLGNEQSVPIGTSVPSANPQDIFNAKPQYEIMKILTLGQQQKVPYLKTDSLPTISSKQWPLAYQQYLLGPSYQWYNSKTKNLDFTPNGSPFVGMYTDYKEQGNYDNQLQELNEIQGIANLGKLNSIAHNNGVVELTYMLKRPQLVSAPWYYVKYRLPYLSFLHNLQNLLIRKPYLRNEPSRMYQELLIGSNVTDKSKDLNELGYDEIVKLTSANGTLITAKVLETNDTVVDKTLKTVQNLNSNLPVENILSLNRNAVVNASLESKKYVMNGVTNNSVQSINKYPVYFANVQRRLGLNPYSNNLYSSSLTYNPYRVYQASPTSYGYGAQYGYNNLLNTKALNVPTAYSQNYVSTYPRNVGYG